MQKGLRAEALAVAGVIAIAVAVAVMNLRRLIEISFMWLKGVHTAIPLGSRFFGIMALTPVVSLLNGVLCRKVLVFYDFCNIVGFRCASSVELHLAFTVPVLVRKY